MQPRRSPHFNASCPSCRCNLDLEGRVKSLLALLDALGGLVTHDTTTPSLAGILVLLHVSLLDGGDELGELGLVLGADLGEGENGSGLVVGLARCT